MSRTTTALLTVLLSSALGGCGVVAGRPGGHADGMTAPGVVLLVRTPRHIAMALKSGANLRSGPEVTVPVVEIIVCDKAVKTLASDPQLAANIAAARGRGIHTRACGLSLERFGVDAATLPAGVDVVPNGIVEDLRLQSLGFLSVELQAKAGGSDCIQHFFDAATSALTYVVHDDSVGVVIDPVSDFDPKNARTSWVSAETVARYIETRRLAIAFVIDTHVHADHMTGLAFFKTRYGAQTVTGSRVSEVQRRCRDIYHLGPDFPVDGRHFDVLIDEGEELQVGSFRARATPSSPHQCSSCHRCR